MRCPQLSDPGGMAIMGDAKLKATTIFRETENTTHRQARVNPGWPDGWCKIRSKHLFMFIVFNATGWIVCYCVYVSCSSIWHHTNKWSLLVQLALFLTQSYGFLRQMHGSGPWPRPWSEVDCSLLSCFLLTCSWCERGALLWLLPR